MRKTIAPTIGFILIVVNLLICLVLSRYGWFNAGLSSAVILLNMLLVWRIDTMGLKDGFRIALDFLMPAIGTVEFFLVALSKPQIEDNGCFVVAICLLAFQLIVLITCKVVSNNVPK